MFWALLAVAVLIAGIKYGPAIAFGAGRKSAEMKASYHAGQISRAAEMVDEALRPAQPEQSIAPAREQRIAKSDEPNWGLAAAVVGMAIVVAMVYVLLT